MSEHGSPSTHPASGRPHPTPSPRAVHELAAVLADLSYRGKQLPEGHSTALATSALRYLDRAEQADAAAQLAELRAECDKVGLPYTARGLLRHHIANRELEAANWRATYELVRDQKAALKRAVEQAAALHSADGEVCVECSTPWPCRTSTLLASATHPPAGQAVRGAAATAPPGTVAD